MAVEREIEALILELHQAIYKINKNKERIFKIDIINIQLLPLALLFTIRYSLIYPN